MAYATQKTRVRDPEELPYTTCYVFMESRLATNIANHMVIRMHAIQPQENLALLLAQVKDAVAMTERDVVNRVDCVYTVYVFN